MSVRTRVAVIGVGTMGARHARVYRELPGANLVAVADVDATRAGMIAERFGVPAYTDHHELVERERPEAVSVAVPTSEHLRVAGDLLGLGCHVLVEKPIAATLDEARALVALAEATRRVLRVGHVERFNPAVVELRRRVAAGEIGRVLEMRARRLGPRPARVRDVGVALDLATHDLDLMRWLAGEEATSVAAAVRRRTGADREDWFSGTVRFADGTLGTVESSWLAAAPLRELLVVGQRGAFLVDYVAWSLRLAGFAESPTGALVPIAKGEPLVAELEEFLDIARGRSLVGGVRGADGRDGLAALALALALLEAADPDSSMASVTSSAWFKES